MEAQAQHEHAAQLEFRQELCRHVFRLFQQRSPVSDLGLAQDEETRNVGCDLSRLLLDHVYDRIASHSCLEALTSDMHLEVVATVPRPFQTEDYYIYCELSLSRAG
jgi:hypothetical protein